MAQIIFITNETIVREVTVEVPDAVTKGVLSEAERKLWAGEYVTSQEIDRRDEKIVKVIAPEKS